MHQTQRWNQSEVSAIYKYFLQHFTKLYDVDSSTINRGFEVSQDDSSPSPSRTPQYKAAVLYQYHKSWVESVGRQSCQAYNIWLRWLNPGAPGKLVYNMLLHVHKLTLLRKSELISQTSLEAASWRNQGLFNLFLRHVRRDVGTN